MKIGVQLSDFTWDGGPGALGSRLADIARMADQGGVDRLSVMDHLWQFGDRAPEREMLEAYTTLGYLAAITERLHLLTVVTGVTYRDPGLLAKTVTTLDVLSGGRAMLGIGAAWYEAEARGLGLFFPPRSERYERLEEVLQICLQMWSDSEAPYDGKHYRLGRTLNSPAPLTRPHPPIMIGGVGEKKTLKLVARYADSCNLFDTDEIARKLDVLRGHCVDEGRDYDSIEKTVHTRFDLGERGERVDETIEHLHELSDLGIELVHGSVKDVASLHQLEVLTERIVPAVAPFGHRDS